MTTATSLYKLLHRHPSAPSSGFDRFVVGPAANRRAELTALMKRMLACTEPTCGRLIIGKNGNGKTLLHKAIQEAATEDNLRAFKEGGRPTFRILFSRVSLSQTETPNIGVELAKNLRRSTTESPDITYASISAEILRRFALTYRSPLTVRWLTAPAKIGLRYALKKYDEYIRDILEETAAEASEGAVDRVFKGIDAWLRRLGLDHDFRRFARSQKMSRFLELYVGSERRSYRSVEELNRRLYDDLGATFGRGQPQDIVLTLASMAKSVGCDLLILEVDDCNEPESIDFLLPIAENFENFKQPKILLIASAVAEVWRHNIDRGLDMSAKQKLDNFFDVIEMPPPNKQDLDILMNRLETLIKTEEAADGRILSWPTEAKRNVLAKCVGLSYREATKLMIDDALHYL